MRQVVCNGVHSAIAAGFLLDAQTEFSTKHSEGEKYTYGAIANNFFHAEFHKKFYSTRPIYLNVGDDAECAALDLDADKERCREENKLRERIMDRMPYLYQPYNMILGILFQLIVIVAWVATAIGYFSKHNDVDSASEPVMREKSAASSNDFESNCLSRVPSVTRIATPAGTSERV